MFLTIMPYTLDHSDFIILSLAGWGILAFILFGCILMKIGKQMEQDDDAISPERKEDE